MSGTTETQTETTTTALTGDAGAAAAETVPPGGAPADVGNVSKDGAAPDEAKVAADKAAADKVAAEKTAAEKAPAELEVKLPEGFAADDALLGEFKAHAKELKLDSAGAQKLVDFWAKAQGALAEKQNLALEQTHQKWEATLKSDKELGGAQFDASVQTARKAMQKFATPELKQFLNETGLGNHPELVRVFTRVGKAMAEDSIAGGKGAARPANSEEALHRKLFPTMFQGS